MFTEIIFSWSLLFKFSFMHVWRCVVIALFSSNPFYFIQTNLNSINILTHVRENTHTCTHTQIILIIMPLHDTKQLRSLTFLRAQFLLRLNFYYFVAFSSPFCSNLLLCCMLFFFFFFARPFFRKPYIRSI